MKNGPLEDVCSIENGDSPASYVSLPEAKSFGWYCWWLKSCTTWDVWNPIDNGKDYLSTGAGFQPSTVVKNLMWIWLIFLHVFFQLSRGRNEFVNLGDLVMVRWRVTPTVMVSSPQTLLKVEVKVNYWWHSIWDEFSEIFLRSFRGCC